TRAASNVCGTKVFFAVTGSQKCQERNFRWTAKANWRRHDSDTGICVELQFPDLVMTQRILSRQSRKDQGTQARKTDLSTMRVPRELQIDGKLFHLVGEVRFVRQQ